LNPAGEPLKRKEKKVKSAKDIKERIEESNKELTKILNDKDISRSHYLGSLIELETKIGELKWMLG